MASIIQHGKRWRALVAVNGVRKSKIFDLKSDAKRWAQEAEQNLYAGTNEESNKTLHAALKKYKAEESPKKKGFRWEIVRIDKFLREMEDRRMDSSLTAYLAEWRDKRLKEVAPSTVRREMNLTNSVLEIARREWKWVSIHLGSDVKKPSSPPPRRRGVSQVEINALVAQLNEAGGKSAEIAILFQLGIETAMRDSELLSAKWDLDKRVATLLDTKNGDKRQVPLSTRAVELLRLVPDGFTVDSASRDALFRKARDKTPYKDVHFHDTRSEGITRLSKKLSIQQLAKAIGHRDLRSLMIYYAETAEEMAKMLD